MFTQYLLHVFLQAPRPRSLPAPALLPGGSPPSGRRITPSTTRLSIYHHPSHARRVWCTSHGGPHITSMVHLFHYPTILLLTTHKRHLSLWHLNSTTVNFCHETGWQSSPFLCRFSWTNQSSGRGRMGSNHHTWGVFGQTPTRSRRGAVPCFSAGTAARRCCYLGFKSTCEQLLG